MKILKRILGVVLTLIYILVMAVVAIILSLLYIIVGLDKITDIYADYIFPTDDKIGYFIINLLK